MWVGKPEKFIREVNFKEIAPSEENSLRIGSKMYLLVLGTMREKFQYNELIGRFENLDEDNIRDSINIYSETEMEKLKREFLSKGYLKQQKKYEGYELTEKGLALLQTYKNLVRANQLIKILEYARLEDQLQILSKLGEVEQNTANLPDKPQERMEDAGASNVEDIWHESIEDDIKSNYKANRDFEQEIKRYLDEIEIGVRYLINETDSAVEEIEEIREMHNDITERKYVSEFGISKEPDLYREYDERKGR